MEGYFTKEPDFWRGFPEKNEELLFDGIWIKRRDIPDYNTPDLDLSVEIWFQWTKGFLPYGGGWADQPAIVIDIIDVMERTYNKWMEWQKEKNGSR